MVVEKNGQSCRYYAKGQFVWTVFFIVKDGRGIVFAMCWTEYSTRIYYSIKYIFASVEMNLLFPIFQSENIYSFVRLLFENILKLLYLNF